MSQILSPKSMPSITVTNGKLHWSEDGDTAPTDLSNAILAATGSDSPWLGFGETPNFFGGFNLFGTTASIAHEAASSLSPVDSFTADAGGDVSFGAESAAAHGKGSGGTS